MKNMIGGNAASDVQPAVGNAVSGTISGIVINPSYTNMVLENNSDIVNIMNS